MKNLTRITLYIVLIAIGITSCDEDKPPINIADPKNWSQEMVQDRLIGTWRREYPDGDKNSRKLLILNEDKTFSEIVELVDLSEISTIHTHAGTWLYDGTNLKRKYTLLDGNPPSRLNLPFVTFEIKFESKNNFYGIDNVHKNEVNYRRVVAGTVI